MSSLQLPKKLAPLIDDQARYKIVYGGRGKGATWGFARALLRLGMANIERILCTREIQRTIKESVHYALKRQIELLNMEGFYKVQDQTIKGRNGTEFIFAGLRDMDAAKLKSMEGVTRVWVAEAHVITEKSWQVLSPTIREKGSEIWVEFNPELDTDPTWVRFIENRRPNSIIIPMSYRDNPWFPDVLEEERLTDYENDHTPGKTKYNWIWEGKCLPAVEGAVFADEVAALYENRRIRPLDYDPHGKVHVVMDLGYRVMTAVLVQRFASTIQIIGYHELYRSTYEKLTKVLKKHDYRWGKVFMPHDAGHKEPRYGTDHKDRMRELGWEVDDIPDIGIENYVTEGREMFQNLYISDSEDCKTLLHCLKRWRYQNVETSVGTRKTGPPMKDEFSHGAEAYCYTAVVADQLTNDEAISDPYKGFSGYAA